MQSLNKVYARRTLVMEATVETLKELQVFTTEMKDTMQSTNVISLVVAL